MTYVKGHPVFRSLKHFLAPATGHRHLREPDAFRQLAFFGGDGGAAPNAAMRDGVWSRSRGYAVVRCAIAAILLTAGVLKTHQLATQPMLSAGPLESRWFLIAVVEFEFCFGLWLFSGLLPFVTWRATLGLFVVFSLISLYKAGSGEVSCGCFGTAKVNPWFTLLLDAFTVGCLLRWRPAQPVLGSGRSTAHGPLRVRLVSLLVAWLCAAVTSGTLMASYQSSRLADVGELLPDGRSVVLEPETWVGKRFPLLDWIETEARLDQGRWIVVLHRSGCSKCEDFLGSGRVQVHPFASKAIAFIDLSPNENPGIHDDDEVRPGVVLGHMSGDLRWYVRPPIEVLVEDGRTVDVLTDLELTTEDAHPGRRRSAE